jgi:site-specific recombinase XerD
MTTYRSGAEQLDAFLAAEGLTNVADIRRRHVEGFIAHLVETRSAATAHVRYRSLQQLFTGWSTRKRSTAPP